MESSSYEKTEICRCNYVAEIIHELHSGSVPTTMLAIFKLVRVLISANMYGFRSTSVVHQPVKPKVVVSTQQRSFGMKCMHEHMFM